MRILELSGSPYAMGQAFGEACRDEIQTFYELRVANALRQAARFGGVRATESDLLRAARASEAATEQWHPDGWDELRGIAEGADMSVTHVLAMNGLTDLRDVLAWPGPAEAIDGCTAFVAQGDTTRDGHALCGQTWDLATDNLPYVLGVHRRPEDAPETWCLTTVGCLSLIGLNDAGIAVGTTNLRTTDARPGVTYLSLIHKALSTRTLDDALSAIADAPRAGGHFFFVLDSLGGAVVLECTAAHHARIRIPTGVYVHANHCLIDENRELEGAAPSTSSCARQDRLTTLLTSDPGQLDLATARRYLGDRANGADAICRDDIDGINTNGAVVMAPASGLIEACHGLPDVAPWRDLKA